MKKVLNKTAEYFQLVLNVKDPKSSYTWPNIQMADGNTLSGRTTNYDLWIYVYAYNANDGAFAQGGPSYFDRPLGRPIVGFINVNLAAIKISELNALTYLGTFAHEIYHIIVFNTDLFKYFVDGDNKLRGLNSLLKSSSSEIMGKTRLIYTGPNVISFVNSYLGITGFEGVALENNGDEKSIGSHWEFVFWQTDFMSAAATTPSLLSMLSLSMAIDSGWFTVNQAYAQPLEYAKALGFDLQGSACPENTVSGFCDVVGKQGCSPDYTYKTICHSDSTFSENCYYQRASVFCPVPSTDYGSLVSQNIEYLGPGSRCLMTKVGSNLIVPRCVRSTCTGTTSILFTLTAGNTCTCATGDVNVTCTDSNYLVTCPSDIADYCTRLQSSNRCPSDCNGKGLCLGPAGNKSCFCAYGWTGLDCSKPNSAESDLTNWGTSSNETNNTNKNETLSNGSTSDQVVVKLGLMTELSIFLMLSFNMYLLA